MSFWIQHQPELSAVASPSASSGYLVDNAGLTVFAHVEVVLVMVAVLGVVTAAVIRAQPTIGSNTVALITSSLPYTLVIRRCHPYIAAQVVSTEHGLHNMHRRDSEGTIY